MFLKVAFTEHQFLHGCDYLIHTSLAGGAGQEAGEGITSNLPELVSRTFQIYIYIYIYMYIYIYIHGSVYFVSCCRISREWAKLRRRPETTLLLARFPQVLVSQPDLALNPVRISAMR